MWIKSLLFLLLFPFFSFAQNIQHFSEQVIFNNGEDNYACYRIPAIVKASNGDLLAFAEGRVNGCSDFGNVDIVLKKSSDHGKSWSELKLIVDNEKWQAGNPAPVLDQTDPDFPQGRIFLFYNTGTNDEHQTRLGNGLREVFYITSSDHGKNWTAPVNITAQVHRPNKPKENNQYNFKEDWRSYANTPGHALQLQKSLYKGRIFIPANHSQGEPLEGFNDYYAHAYYSDDHSKSWHLSESIDVPSSNESIAVELSDGRIMQNIRHQNGSKRQRLIALSSDGGETWDSTYFDPQLPSPVCQASMIDYKTPSGKKVLLFSNPSSQKARENMTVRVSYDDGKTWLLSRIVREGEAAYSDLVIQENDDIGLLYEHGNDGGIYYANFNFDWLAEGKNHTDHALIQKLKSSGESYAQDFQFQLAPPIIQADQLLFEDENTIRLKLDYEGTRIHYTLDGTLPDEQSLLYKVPIQINKSVEIKTRAYHNHCLPSDVVQARYIKLGKKLPIKSIALNRTAHEKYPGTGPEGLIDRKKGDLNFRDPAWMGFSGGDIEAIIEFDKKTTFRKITASMFDDPNAWIFLPQSIIAWSSDNGKSYKKLASRDFVVLSEKSKSGLSFLELEFKAETSKFLKITIKNIPEIPEWHPGKGTPAWLFIDELLID